jgi:hypothetical protein
LRTESQGSKFFEYFVCARSYSANVTLPLTLRRCGDAQVGAKVLGQHAMTSGKPSGSVEGGVVPYDWDNRHIPREETTELVSNQENNFNKGKIGTRASRLSMDTRNIGDRWRWGLGTGPVGRRL